MTRALVATRRGVAAPMTTKFDSVADDFVGTTLSSDWVAGGATLVSGRARMNVAATSGSSDALTTSPSSGAPDYTIKESVFAFQIATMPDVTGVTTASGTWVRARIILKSDTTKNLTFRVTPASGTGGLLLAIGIDGAEVTVTYSPTTMKYFRFRETGGTVYFDTSADGIAWTQRSSAPSPAWITTTANQRAYFDAQKSTGSTTGVFWELEDVNTAPTITVPGPVATMNAVENTTTAPGTIDVTWTPPTSDGGSAITGYHVFRDQPDWTSSLQASTLRAFSLSNFTAATTYTIKVRAVNNIGVGPWTTRTVTMGGGSSGGGSGTGSGFRAAILATAPVRYYPLNSQYPLDDMVGGLDLTNAGGGVTFTSAGAVFQGVSNDYLTGPTGTDIQIGRSVWNAADNTVTRTQMAIFIAVTFPTYVQPSQFHWMSCGGDVRGPGVHEGNFTWAMRLYGDGSDAARDRNVSAYYWNPNPTYDLFGVADNNSKGSGSFLAPPEGARTPPNGPSGSGTIGVEHWFGIHFGYAGANGYAGACQMYYGQASPAYPMTMISNRLMNSDRPITPVMGNGRLFIGKRGDSDGMVKATIRRVAFWNRFLTQTEWRSFANPTTMALTED